MLDKIMEMVGGQAIEAITSKAGISTDQAKAMLPLAQESLTEGITSKLSSGGMDDILGMFNSASDGGLENNGIFGSIKGMFLQKIMTSLGLPASVAGLAAGSGLGSIVTGITGMLKQDGDNDGIDASNIMSVLGGGGALSSILGAVTGGADGAAGMVGDLAGKILGGATDAAGGAGDLADGLKGAAGDLLGGGGDAAKKAGGLLGGIMKMFGKK